ncbi:hypothetical protein F0562_026851 [Nyssa sinensis]|uniref:Uncharacterized protein n=1 Tax=Nyssa sinensis TaxID=561372 RepID=A0A5J5B6I4_9ASTE|nr:hypothetical protein F0562_026851 [Nyssa sinensis]
MVRGGRAELQPAQLGSGVSARFCTANEDQARRKGNQAERGKTGKGAGRLRKEAWQESYLAGNDFLILRCVKIKSLETYSSSAIALPGF